MAEHGLPSGSTWAGAASRGAPVDLERGESPTNVSGSPPPASDPGCRRRVIADIVDAFDDVRGGSPIGITIPGVVTHGIVRTAANIDKGWIDFDAEAMLEDKLRHDVVLVNDADAAGVAEVHYGAAKGSGDSSS